MQQEPQFQMEADAEIYLSIFPHVDEFFLLDVRSDLPGGPMARLLKVAEVLGDDYLQEIEQRFSQMLREKPGFLNLLRVPERIGYSIQRRMVRRILRQGLPPERLGATPKVTMFIATGQALDMPRKNLEAGLKRVMGQDADPLLLSYCIASLTSLFDKERQALKAVEQDRMREVIRGDSPLYRSLWEKEEGQN